MAAAAAALLLLAGCEQTPTVCPAYALSGSITVLVPASAVPGQPDAARLCLEAQCALAALGRVDGGWQVESHVLGHGGDPALVRVELLRRGRSVLSARERVRTTETTSGEGVCRQRATAARATYDPATRTLVPV